MSIEYTPGPLLDAAHHTPTALRNDSSDPGEPAQSISFDGVGATCNPTIAYTCINQRRDVWLPRIAELAKEMPDATESEIGWQVVRELSLEAAKLLEPICRGRERPQRSPVDADGPAPSSLRQGSGRSGRGVPRPRQEHHREDPRHLGGRRGVRHTGQCALEFRAI